MKYLAILFISYFGFSQESNEPELVQPILDNFYVQASSFDFYPRQFLETNLKGIYIISRFRIEQHIGHINDNRAGTIAYYYNYLLNRKEVMILLDEMANQENIEAFIYHELGHIFGLRHSDGIMAPKINKAVMTPFNLEVYFQRLKSSPPNSYRTNLRL